MKILQHVLAVSMILLLVVGCNSQSTVPEGFYSYEKEQIKEAIDELDFSPELPSYVPVAADILVTDHFYIGEQEDEAFDITMFTQDNDIFTIQLINGQPYQDNSNFEPIFIQDSLEGYYQDQVYSKTLRWEKEGITYQMIYRPSEQSLSQDMLQKVAESFETS
ncbi:hypothetical protein SH601_06580 [Gracilibacillus sp. S3-1-1]|uniref:Uncharacterized protein n=1 Tax=Gracilibacillus pellucidus TaxID=3095368 RepID=A0ACC6M3W0_9BACI|nr:hypothetical protein [Gracilibacillus sp. S3-1-1]MDX8045651.1 hypothetical protein [Gracilibacillus sp. S3-1-1]